MYISTFSRVLLLFYLFMATFYAVAKDANLIKNGGFEDGIKSWKWGQWKGANIPGRLDEKTSHTGKASFIMNIPGATGPRAMKHIIPVDPRFAYKLRLWLKCKNIPEGAVSIKLLQWGTKKNPGKVEVQGWVAIPGGRGVNELFRTGGTHDWKEFEIVFPVGSIKRSTKRLTLFISHDLVGVGELGIDEVFFGALGKGAKTVIEKEKSINSIKKSQTERLLRKQVFKLTKPPHQQGNIIYGDSSFETGNGDWSNSKNDSSTAVHGTHSLLLNGDRNARSKIYYYLIKAKQRYNFSFYAKSAKPKTEINVGLHHLKYGTMARRTFVLSPQWKRYKINIAPQKKQNSFYITVSPVGQQTASKIWLDAMQLQTGNTADKYVPAESTAINFANTDGPGNIIFTSVKPLNLELGVFNFSKPENEYTITHQTEDYYKNIVQHGKYKIKLPEDTGLRKKIIVLEHREKGYYVVTATLKDKNGKIINQTKKPFGIVAPPSSDAERENSFFGMHPGRVSLHALKRIGVKWIRSFISWKNLYKENGGNTLSDNYGKKYTDNNLSIMLSVKVSEMPKWARADSGKLKDVNDYGNWCASLVAKLGKRIKYWEVENEPDLTFPRQMNIPKNDAGQYYGEVVKAAYRVIKKVDPKAQVLAVSSSGGTQNNNFVTEAVKSASGFFDIITPHPYTGARYIGPGMTYIGPDSYMRDQLLKCMERVKKYAQKQKIWVGEIGWALDFREPYLSKYAKTQANYMARTIILAKSVPDVEKLMWFKAQGCYERHSFDYGIWRSEFEPLPAAVFYSNLAQILEDAKAVKPLFESDVRAYAFEKRNGTPLIALWKYQGDTIEMLIDVDSDQIELLDMLGNQVEFVRKKGKIVLPVSESPVFILGKQIATDKLCQKIADAEVAMEPVTISLFYSNLNSISGSVKNNLPRKLKSNLKMRTPQGLTALPDCIPLDLPPGGSASFTFNLKRKQGILDNEKIEVVCNTARGSVSKILALKLQACPKKKPNIVLPQIVLTERSKIYPPDSTVGWDGVNDLSVKANISWDAEYFYFNATVKDDIHYQKVINSAAWNGDSIQLAFDQLNDALATKRSYDSNDLEFIAYLSPSGAKLCYTFTANKGTGAEVKNAKVSIQRSKGVTTYRIAISWSEFDQLTPFPGRIFGFNFIVNENDGNGRAYWMGPTLGIGEMKYPYCFKKFIIKK